MVYTKSFHKEDVEFRKVLVYSLVLTQSDQNTLSK